ncbi:cysteine-rich receptor-like protein kinase 25 [Pyrus ussuriensis x Pyrus communis]|uniref:non-specific serine/threonine protein kinase n=1 Tax=Pyrus ussuriensis x Pyrus communis TaxID=2448454 RepID=A0A5N5IGG0_9ROSA|nr:cysteine-rich receptor-like protein kinase 25 [Pyrus ussuriensis x Pyrus communis]
MKMSMILLLFLSMLSSLSLITSNETGEFLDIICPNTNTFTSYTGWYSPSTDSFQSNLNKVLNTLTSPAAHDTGFYNITAGLNSTEKAYGLFLCQGYVSTDVCKDCVTAASIMAAQRCPSRINVIVWYDCCMLRYSNESLSTLCESPIVNWRNTQNATEWNRFNQVLGESMNEVVTEATVTANKFATKQANISRFLSVYSLAQCTWDLSTVDCNRCLKLAVALLPSCCEGSVGGRVLMPSCNIRFEIYPFYLQNATSARATAPKALPPPAPKGRRKHFSTIIIVVGYVGIALLVFSLVLVALGCCFPGRREGKKNDEDMRTAESLQFDLETLETATNKFSEDNKLGEGGFGAVFRYLYTLSQGMLTNGQEIAVKRLSKSSGQGVQEFKNEVVLVAKLQHRNLVRLLGFCLEGEETLLVYEYVPNKSLDYFLFEHKKREQLDWLSRTMIIGGIARGILYLHEDSRLRVIHRDLKASNILLDINMNSKISDFGMARMFGVDDQTEGNTKRIVGTYGYMAPEYAMEGLYSVKSDVFSFGVLLLEIITGRRNFLGFHRTNCGPTLIGYAWQLWNETKGLELMDPLLKDSCSPNEFFRYIHIGLLCVQEDANNRPTMSSVVHLLKTETIIQVFLSRPEKPAFFTGRYVDHHDQVRSQDCSANGLTISIDVPR